MAIVGRRGQISKNRATLTYFKACDGPGKAAEGFKNPYDGGLDIDSQGNLVSLSMDQLFIYKGCNPACSLVGGPFALRGEAFFGHLDERSLYFAACDFENSTIDVYRYSAKGVKFKYSFNNGIQGTILPTGIAYGPRSKE